MIPRSGYHCHEPAIKGIIRVITRTRIIELLFRFQTAQSTAMADNEQKARAMVADAEKKLSSKPGMFSGLFG